MSIKIMSIVWAKAPVDSGALLVLLALADNADDTGKAFPGVPYLAAKARMSERNVQLCLRKLADAGFIRIHHRGGPSGANKYQIVTNLLCSMPDVLPTSWGETDGEKTSPPKNFHPVKNEAQGVKNDASGGEVGFTLTVIEPSEEPLNVHARTREPISKNVLEENNSRSNSAIVSETVDRDPRHDEAGEKISGENAAQVKRAFQRFVNNWPGFGGLSLAKAEREWFALSADDRAAASAKRDAWIALLRRNGKDHTPAPSTYLHERLWETVPDEVEIVAPTVVKPFGKAWMANVLAQLKKPAADLPSPPAFIAKQIAEGTEIGKREHRNRLALYGWPKVNFMFHQAYDGIGGTVSQHVLAELPDMEALAVDSPAYHEWQIAFAERGWPWFKVPECVKFVWFPKGGPMSS
jgi:hypothetical protein